MRAPNFWNVKSGRESAPILRALMMPLSYIYDYWTQKRIYEAKVEYIGAPVISIGNITLGGTGKTPITLEICNIVNDLWGKPAIVSRGHGGEIIDAIKVDINSHNAKNVGDEPIMMAHYNDVFIGRNRPIAAKLAIENGAKIIILDDAHQNPYLHKNLSFVVIDGAVGFGNHQICPAGPLRETIETGLKRADAIIWVGNRELEKEELEDFHKPIFYADIKPQKTQYSGKYLAFCGIGRPHKFENSLKEANVEILDLIPFADHHYFKPNELKNLQNRANELGAKLITTEKDYVRLPKEFAQNCEVFKIKIEFHNPKYLREYISTILKKVVE
jgi:tetraacyldisaccharide 4'-kinase